MGKKGLDQGVVLSLTCEENNAMTARESLSKVADDVERMGKRKSWDGGFGIRVRVDVHHKTQL